MRGANSSAVYKVCSDANQCFVLRVFDDAERWIRGLNLAAQEVAALAQAGRSKVNSPEVIGFEIDNIGFGKPVVLTSLLPGAVELQPRDMRKYCGQLARTLAQIHAHKTHAFDWQYRS